MNEKRWLKNIKITVKFALSASAFLLPLGIMLFSIISMSLGSITKNKSELNGLNVIRPAISLMQVIPRYIRHTIDGVPGDANYIREQVSETLRELHSNYETNFSSKIIDFNPDSITAHWNEILNANNRASILSAFENMIQELYKLIIYTCDISELNTDSDIESIYYISAIAHEIPQTQERIVFILNFLRRSGEHGISNEEKKLLLRQLDLLIHSDNVRIQNRFKTAEFLEIQQSDLFESFERYLLVIFNNILYFSDLFINILNTTDIQDQYIPVLFESANQINNSIYRLQNASLDRLEIIIKSKINSNYLRLTLMLTAVVVSSIFAFFIIFTAIRSIRKSTFTMSKVFKQLDNNDLSVNIQTYSNDEIGEFMTSLDYFLKKINDAFDSFNSNASMVSKAAMEMSSSSMEITATANEQSTSIAEIVSTMENNKNLSAQASEKTLEVAQLASHTQELSLHGAELRNDNEKMMFNIRNQNAKIIETIKNLDDMLSRIDESVQLIDTIADHTKLIAFNAALEASSSGEAGTRFSVVAGEIRRFADNVVESVTEIKEKIIELQETSNSLITEANSGTNVIDSGYKKMVEQKTVFENIVEVSKNVAINSQQISSLSKQQELASAQIFTTLKEISTGLKYFVTATAKTQETVEKINSMSSELKETLAKYNTNNSVNE